MNASTPIARGLAAGAMLILSLGATALAGRANPAAGAQARESAFACVPSALSPTLRKRHFEELGPRLRSLRKGVHELPDGYEFEFSSDPATYAMLSEWMFQERSCCPFFDLDLRLDREGGAMWLRLTGRQGVKDFIREEFPRAWFQKSS